MIAWLLFAAALAADPAPAPAPPTTAALAPIADTDVREFVAISARKVAGRPVGGPIASADKVLGSEGFRYVGEWLNDSGAILEFTNTLDGIEVNGIDMIRFDADGKIIHFKVMVRPLKAVNHVHQLMKAQLEAMMASKAS